jgi:hypothetical protein
MFQWGSGRAGGAGRLACEMWWACVMPSAGYRHGWRRDPIGAGGARFARAQSAGPVLTGEEGVTRGGPRVPVGPEERMRGRFRKGGAGAARERVGLGRARRGFYRQSLRVVAVIGFDLIDFA